MRLQTPLGSSPVVPSARDLSTLFERDGELLAGEWRKRYYANDTSLTTVAQLDGVIEHLITEIGHSIAEPTDLPAAAWGRTGGVLRLSQSRGATGLHEEFAVLRGVLEGAALAGFVPYAQRKRLRTLLDASEGQALALLGRTVDPDGSYAYPMAGFAGVVVETP